MTTKRCGTLAFMGKPNAGKSTLLNQCMGRKVSIISHKAQTTDRGVLAVKTIEEDQLIFIDTPGINDRENRQSLDFTRTAKRECRQADIWVWVKAHPAWDALDQALWELIQDSSRPCLLVLNKQDRWGSAPSTPTLLAALTERVGSTPVLTCCARQGKGVDAVLAHLRERLPEGEHRYADSIERLDSPQQWCLDLLREKMLLFVHDEIPYHCELHIDHWEDTPERLRIEASIILTRASQRAIVIGRGGETLKRISSSARHDLEQSLQRSVYLRVQVKT